MQDSNNTRKHALIATTAIFFSRILGLVREQVFAFFFGAGMVLDAFVVAFRIPNLLRDLFAEGALSQSFVTIFSQKLATQNKEQAYTLAHKVAAFIVLFIGSLVILGEIFAPQLVGFLASGFTGEKFALTVTLTRILMPFIFFVSLAALLMGMLNAQQKFFLPQSASTFFNFTSIVAGLGFAYLLSPDYISASWQKLFSGGALNTTDTLGIATAITGMALGTLLGGIVQMAIQLPALKKLGFDLKLNFKLKGDEGFYKVLALTGPAIIGGAAVQVNVLINTYFASHLADGSVAYLNYAFRLMQFPLGVFGVAVALASAPALAKMLAAKRNQDFLHTIQSSMQMSLFLSIPSAVGLFALSHPIISLIYEHGRFDFNDGLQTSYALMAYSLGIWSYVLIKIYQPAYLAFHDAKTPMKVSVFSIILNFAINWYFIRVLHLPHWSLALGTAIVATCNFLFLAILFYRKMGGLWRLDGLVNILKISVAALCMGFVAQKLLQVFYGEVCSIDTLGHALSLFMIIGCCGGLYFGLCFAFRVTETKVFVQKILKRSKT